MNTVTINKASPTENKNDPEKKEIELNKNKLVAKLNTSGLQASVIASIKSNIEKIIKQESGNKCISELVYTSEAIDTIIQIHNIIKENGEINLKDFEIKNWNSVISYSAKTYKGKKFYKQVATKMPGAVSTHIEALEKQIKINKILFPLQKKCKNLIKESVFLSKTEKVEDWLPAIIAPYENEYKNGRKKLKDVLEGTKAIYKILSPEEQVEKRMDYRRSGMEMITKFLRAEFSARNFFQKRGSCIVLKPENFRFETFRDHLSYKDKKKHLEKKLPAEIEKEFFTFLDKETHYFSEKDRNELSQHFKNLKTNKNDKDYCLVEHQLDFFSECIEKNTLKKKDIEKQKERIFDLKKNRKPDACKVLIEELKENVSPEIFEELGLSKIKEEIQKDILKADTLLKKAQEFQNNKEYKKAYNLIKQVFEINNSEEIKNTLRILQNKIGVDTNEHVGKNETEVVTGSSKEKFSEFHKIAQRVFLQLETGEEEQKDFELARIIRLVTRDKSRDELSDINKTDIADNSLPATYNPLVNEQLSHKIEENTVQAKHYTQGDEYVRIDIDDTSLDKTSTRQMKNIYNNLESKKIYKDNVSFDHSGISETITQQKLIRMRLQYEEETINTFIEEEYQKSLFYSSNPENQKTDTNTIKRFFLQYRSERKQVFEDLTKIA